MLLNVLANTQLNRALASGRPLFTQTGPDPRDQPDHDLEMPVETQDGVVQGARGVRTGS